VVDVGTTLQFWAAIAPLSSARLSSTAAITERMLPAPSRRSNSPVMVALAVGLDSLAQRLKVTLPEMVTAARGWLIQVALNPPVTEVLLPKELSEAPGALVSWWAIWPSLPTATTSWLARRYKLVAARAEGDPTSPSRARASIKGAFMASSQGSRPG
jgi:hypothetical protein